LFHLKSEANVAKSGNIEILVEGQTSQGVMFKEERQGDEVLVSV
jgi:hypothetical protein